MKVLVACEESQVVCKALRDRGVEAYSCDIQDCSGGHPEWHIKGDALKIAYDESYCWDAMIAHPPCTRLANSGHRWLYNPPSNPPDECLDIEKENWALFQLSKRREIMWRLLDEGSDFYDKIRNAPIKVRIIENPVMHGPAVERIGIINRKFVHPWMFGDRAFKFTGFEYFGIGPIIEGEQSLRGIIPKKGTEEHKKWSRIHRLSPSPTRAKERSKTFPGIGNALADLIVGHFN